MRSVEPAPKPRLQKVAALFPAIFALLTATASVGLSQEEPEPRISLSLRKVPLRQALALASRGSYLSYSLAPEVSEVPITVEIRSQTYRQAFRQIARAGRAVFPRLTRIMRSDLWFFRRERVTPVSDLRRDTLLIGEPNLGVAVSDKLERIQYRGSSARTPLDDEGSTALMLAAADGNLSEMRRLISLGAEVNARNDWEASALIWACAAGKRVAAFDLIDAGADVDKDGVDAVYIAARLGHEELAWALIDKGVAAKPQEISQSLVSVAPFLGPRFARYCLAKGGSLNAADSEGSTVLMQAALHGNRRLVKWLLRHGAEVDQKDSNRSTALSYAMEGFQRNDIILDLLRAGASPKTKSRFAGDTVLHYAVGAEDFNLARKVLLLGADPDAKDDSEKTAFERYHRDLPRIKAEIQKLRDYAMKLRSTAPRDGSR